MLRRITKRTWAIAGAAVVAAAAIVLGVIVVPALGAHTTTYKYTDDHSAIANPERGWYDRIDSILTQRDFSETVDDKLSILHSYVRLDAFRNSPIDQATLDELQQGLDAVRKQGLKIVLRFAYNDGPYPDSEPDASEAVILEQLKQLAPVLARNSDVILSVEAGFIGAWGEWHSSTNGLDTSLDDKKTILKAILAAVPSSLDVALRYPSDLRAIEGKPLSSTVPNGSDQSRIGSHQDCFLSGEPDDDGTWSRDGSSPAADKKLISQIGRYAIVGGETCNPDVPKTTTCAKAVDELSFMHFSYLNRDFEPNTLAKFKKEGCYDTIGADLGYRISLEQAELPNELSPGGSARISLKLKNSGYASPVNARPAYIVLTGKGRTATVPLDTDVRSWDPGTISVNTTIKVPADLPAGSYTMSLWLPDASKALQKRPAYSIHLASVGVWRQNTGYNVLATVPVR